MCFSTSSEVSCEGTDLQGLFVVATAAHLLQHDSHQSLHKRARPAPIEEDLIEEDLLDIDTMHAAVSTQRGLTRGPRDRQPAFSMHACL